ncbi:MAG: glycosyltransferase family 2 protein [Lachnospiraceae bacterium]|nr:glycosyltransferase family 2 protein [Lachnospiraceae bacterium]
MVTISACMIVKNEAAILRRCLDSLKDLYDELVIVDTGSTDDTKAIASEYTDKIYEFEWIDDFSAARNFATSKATCDYVYVPDADEVLDEENRRKFKLLKGILDPQVDIVQMKYVNQLNNGSVYNFDEELRPKLFRRVRTFTFIDPIHETLRLDPVVYDSDIDIIHMQGEVHADRDLRVFEKMLKEGIPVSERLLRLYTRELLSYGTKDNFLAAVPFYKTVSETKGASADLLKLCYIILTKAAVLSDDPVTIMKYAIKDVIMSGTSELCTILGDYFEKRGDLDEAAVWYINAHFETEPEVYLCYKNEMPLEGLIRLCEAKGDKKAADGYRERLKLILESDN